MPAALVTCDNEAHLRAFVCKLLADKIGFSVYPSNLSVRFEKDADDPTYADRALRETAGGAVHFDFDTEESKGRLTVTPGGYGPTLAIDGEEVGYVDMFEAAAENRGGGDTPRPPQLLLFCPTYEDTPMAKAFLDPDGKMVVIVHKDAEELGDEHSRSIHGIPPHARSRLGADRGYKSVTTGS